MPRTYVVFDDGAGRRLILPQQVVTPTKRNLLRDPETLQRLANFVFDLSGLSACPKDFLLPRPIDRNVMGVRTLCKYQSYEKSVCQGRSWQFWFFLLSRVFEFNSVTNSTLRQMREDRISEEKKVSACPFSSYVSCLIRV